MPILDEWKPIQFNQLINLNCTLIWTNCDIYDGQANDLGSCFDTKVLMYNHLVVSVVEKLDYSNSSPLNWLTVYPKDKQLNLSFLVNWIGKENQDEENKEIAKINLIEDQF